MTASLPCTSASCARWPTDTLDTTPAHPYTEAHLASVPAPPSAALAPIAGRGSPSPLDHRAGADSEPAARAAPTKTSRPATWPPARTSRRRRRSAHGYGGLLLRLLQLRRRRPLRRVHHAVRQHAAGTPGRHVPVIAVSRALQVAPHRCHPIPLRASSDDAGARVASTSMQPAAARRHRHGGVLVPDASSIALSGRPRPRRPGDRVMPAPPDGGHLA